MVNGWPFPGGLMVALAEKTFTPFASIESHRRRGTEEGLRVPLKVTLLHRVPPGAVKVFETDDRVETRS